MRWGRRIYAVEGNADAASTFTRENIAMMGARRSEEKARKVQSTRREDDNIARPTKINESMEATDKFGLVSVRYLLEKLPVNIKDMLPNMTQIM